MIDLSKTKVIVTAWPDQRWPVQLVHWIERLFSGVDTRQDFRDSIKVRNQVCARNQAVKISALRSHTSYEWFIFVDHDVRPVIGTETFLELDTDVRCCQMPHNSKTAWGRPDAFHDGLWAISRESLTRIEGPWFYHSYNDDHTQMEACICSSFRSKALEAGLTISHGGWAEHDRDGSWC